MEAEMNKLCCGCLSNGRKMKSVRDYWSNEDFSQLLTETLRPVQEMALWLCWECEARLMKFITFKEQMRTCSQSLLKYAKDNFQSPPQTKSNLKIQIQEYYNTKRLSDVENNHIKHEKAESELEPQNENVTELKIKDETEYMDDDRFHTDGHDDKMDVVITENKTEKKKKAVKKGKREDIFMRINLSTQEILQERCLMEAQEEYVNSKFKCPKCIQPFPSEDDFKEHVVGKHELHAERNIKCGVCERTFRSEAALAHHSRRHSVRWRCSLCLHHSGTEQRALHHYQHLHTDSKTFDLATKAYETYSDKLQDSTENNELNKTNSEDLIPCQYCEKKFRWKTSLRKHIETHKIEAGQKRKPHCQTCQLNFTTTANLQKHVRTSSKHQIQLKLGKLKEELPIDNADPNQQAKDIEQIKSKINGQKELFPCPQCEKKFQWKGNLLRHLQSHAARANGDLVCVPCNRTFSSIATYKQHMKISRKHVSENEFKYMCSECGKRFANKTNLRDHTDWEHLRRYTHACAACRKVFRTHTSLYLHRQVVHRRGEGHLCHQCGKGFANKTKLGSHIGAVHSRESPYKCDTCSARFSWHSCLSRHMRRVHRNTQNKTK